MNKSVLLGLGCGTVLGTIFGVTLWQLAEALAKGLF